MTAVKTVLVLALFLVVAVANTPVLSNGMRWLLLLLALAAGILAGMRHKGTL